MAKQTTVGSSTDRWQQPQSRGSGLLPPHQHQAPASAVTSSASGIISEDRVTPVASSSSHPQTTHQTHAYPGGQGQTTHLFPAPPPQHHARKKSFGGTVVDASLGEGTSRDVMPLPTRRNPPTTPTSREHGRAHHQQHPQPSTSQGACGVDRDRDITANFHHHDVEALDPFPRNPLICLICNNVFDDPRLLSCFHSFCAKCLPGRQTNGKLVCPLCGKPTALKDGSGPQTDLLLRFLLHTASNPLPSCANCGTCDTKIRAAMFYCNTCAHEVIPVSKYTTDTAKKHCAVHGEQYIMFSNAQKSMLCIHCYRDTAADSRLHCVDLDTAYTQGSRRLDRAVMNLRDLQIAVRDGITMLKNVLEELRRNADSEKSAVNAVVNTILDALTKTQENLLKDVDCQAEGKDRVIRGQLCQLRSVLPTIKLHLTMCATIANATNKYDFLDLAYPLIDRLTAIAHMGVMGHMRPGQSAQIRSTYKPEIARTLEPWVGTSSSMMGATASSLAPPRLPIRRDHAHSSSNPPPQGNEIPIVVDPAYAQYYPMSRSTAGISPGHKQTSGGYAVPSFAPQPQQPPQPAQQPAPPADKQSLEIKIPVFKIKDGVVEENFTEHCRSFSAHVNELNQRLNRLKEQVQELHRDITFQRGDEYVVRAESALREGTFLEDQLEKRRAEMERIRSHLETYWNDNIRRLQLEQDVFEAQMNELLKMQTEVKHLSSLLQQLQSFLKNLIFLPFSSQQQPPDGDGGGGPGLAGGATGLQSSGGLGGPNMLLGAPVGNPSAQGTHHGQSNRTQGQHSQHLPHAPDAFFSRSENGTQVTPSLAEISYHLDQTKGQQQQSFVSDPNSRSRQQVEAQSQAPITHGALNQRYQGGLTTLPPPPSVPPKPPAPPVNMDYIHIEADYAQPHLMGMSKSGRPIMGMRAEKKPQKPGVFSQIKSQFDKVRQRDDRKKSSASRVSSTLSGGTTAAVVVAPQPQPPQPPAPLKSSLSNLTARRALTYDAQCQFGLESSNSAVSALSQPHSSTRVVGFGDGGVGARTSKPVYNQRESRSTTTRTNKSFVKSNSDDERPPSKLSQQSRARSAGQLETESLLRSLCSGSADASRIIELYKSLSKTIIENQQRQSYPQGYNQKSSSFADHHPSDQRRQPSTTCNVNTNTQQPRDPTVTTSYQSTKSNSLGRTSGGLSYRPNERMMEDDYYQQIPVNRTFPISRSHSATPRKQQETKGNAGVTSQVKVYVHEEPRRTPSSPPGTLSKSMEESYLYGYLSHPTGGGGGLASSSSGQSGPAAVGVGTSGKKGNSDESLNSNNGGEDESRKSSIDFDRRSVVTIRRAGSKPAIIGRQHSWEGQLGSHSQSTPQLSPSEDPFESGGSSLQSSGRGVDKDTRTRPRSATYDEEEMAVGNTLHKADSFEGHEEAVERIVAAVHMQRRLQSN